MNSHRILTSLTNATSSTPFLLINASIPRSRRTIGTVRVDHRAGNIVTVYAWGRSLRRINGLTYRYAALSSTSQRSVRRWDRPTRQEVAIKIPRSSCHYSKKDFNHEPR